MRFLLMTDIEGVTGVTSYEQAERSAFGREMLMHDLLAVIGGIRSTGAHEIVVYDMHTDGRNIDMSKLPEDVCTVVGKPINGEDYRGVGGKFDGLFLVGLHAMSHTPGAMLAHSYLREYDEIYLNDILVGEIGVEAALAGEQRIPLLLVSGDDKGCVEAERLLPGVTTAAVKYSLGPAQALCRTPDASARILHNAAQHAVEQAQTALPWKIGLPVDLKVRFSDCKYLHIMRCLHPEIFEDAHTIHMKGAALLPLWSEYLVYEQEMLDEALRSASC